MKINSSKRTVSNVDLKKKKWSLNHERCHSWCSDSHILKGKIKEDLVTVLILCVNF